MKSNPFLFLLCFSIGMLSSCQPPVAETASSLTYESESLKISPLSPNTYVHVTYLYARNFGMVPCNGMIVTHRDSAIVFDTPSRDSVSLELINWIEQQGYVVKGVVINHFHDDCLGGLQVFHDRGIPSFAHTTTIDFAKKDSAVIPLYGFKGYLELGLGGIGIENKFWGPGHSYDNIVSYVPADSVLFGGCMVKSLGAGRGNLADADTLAWSQTVTQIKSQYPYLKQVIPGHGKVGGVELLEYTVEMFSQEDSNED